MPSKSWPPTLSQQDQNTLVRSAFGKVLATRRLAAGFDQRPFARLVGISNSHLRKLEAGETSPTLVTLYKIANVLKVDAGYLISQTDYVIQESRLCDNHV